MNIDLDGVVADFNGAFLRHASHVLGRDFGPTQTWNFWDEMGISEAVWQNLFRRGVEYGTIWGPKSGPPIEGAIEGLWALSDAEVYIRLVTHRLAHPFGHMVAVRQTVEWLDKYSVPYRSLAVVGPESKANFVAQALVDDSVPNIEAWNDLWGGGIIFDQPWNHEYRTEERAFDWEDVVRLVMEAIES